MSENDDNVASSFYELERNIEKDGIWNAQIPGKISRWLGVGSLVGLLTLGAMDGWYINDKKEQGVVTTWGQYTNTTGPGLHFKIPFIQDVEKVNVTEYKKQTIGFVEGGRLDTNDSQAVQRVINEKSMLTADENIVDLSASVQYVVSDPRDFLYNCGSVDGTVRDAIEAALRQIVGDSGIDEALTTGKDRIEVDALKLLREIMEPYRCGVSIERLDLHTVDPPREVAKAFTDVESARNDKANYVNQAQRYANKVIPEARGKAQRQINEAQGYAAKVVDRAKGDVARFNEVLVEYQAAPEITTDRIYIDTMGEIMPNLELIIMDGNQGAVPLLHMESGFNRGGNGQ